MMQDKEIPFRDDALIDPKEGEDDLTTMSEFKMSDKAVKQISYCTRGFMMMLNSREPRLFIVKVAQSSEDEESVVFSKIGEYGLKVDGEKYKAHFVGGTVRGEDILVHAVTDDGC